MVASGASGKSGKWQVVSGKWQVVSGAKWLYVGWTWDFLVIGDSFLV